MEFHLLDPLHDPSPPSSFIDFLGVEMQNISNPWKIEKVLFSTDVGANSSHLHLPKADEEAHILTAMNEEMVTTLQTLGRTSWLMVRLVDEDEGTVYDGMKLTHYYSTSDRYVLNGAWNKICKERVLQVNDKVGLYWDPAEHALHFSVRQRAFREDGVA